MQIGDIVQLKIDKLVFEGAGLARKDGLTIFVDGVCPGDIVKAELISINKTFARAKFVELIVASDKRVKPFCAMSNVCGGCCWQHVDYTEQLVQKKNIVIETIKKIAGLDVEVGDVISSNDILGYRHKTQYPVSQTKVSKRLLAGYYKKNTHEIVNIKHCPVQPKIVDDIVDFIRENISKYNITAYDEKKHKGTLRHIVCRHSAFNQKTLLILVVNDIKLHNGIKLLLNDIFEKFDEISGCVVNFNTKKTNTIFGEKTITVIGDDFYNEKLGEKIYKISSNSFFQVNPSSAINLLETAKKMIVENTEKPKILDAYSGVGSFGIYLSDIAESVTFVEDYAPACADALINVGLNNLKNYEILTGDAKVELKKLVDRNEKYDVVILDPPRKGLSEEALNFAVDLSKNIIVYVSCNPTTLARDLKLFKEKGFEPQYVQPVDMFCHTFHIENVALLKKN